MRVAEQQWYLVVKYFSSDLPLFRITIPLETKEQNQNIQLMAAVNLNMPSFPGTFQESFPNLSRLSKGLGSLSLKQLQEHIGELLASGFESVEIFGAKLPVVFLRTWGILIFFSAQLYYYLRWTPKFRQLAKVHPAL